MKLAALPGHPHHKYYNCREDTDLTSWLVYFIDLLAHVFTLAKEEAVRLKEAPLNPEPDALRRLDHRPRIVLELFARQETITTALVAETLGLSDRMARNLMQEWVE